MPSPLPVPSDLEIREFCNAAETGAIDKMRRLLATYSANIVNAYPDDCWHRAALHRAWYKEVAELLLDNGADIEQRDRQGLTPVDLAAFPTTWVKRYEVLEALISRGADIKKQDDQGRALLDMCRLRLRNVRDAERPAALKIIEIVEDALFYKKRENDYKRVKQLHTKITLRKPA